MNEDIPKTVPVRTILAVVIGVLVIGGAVGAFFFFRSQTATYSDTRTVLEVLRQTNQDFSDGTSYVKQGKYADALESYTKALANAKDSSQEGQIRFAIGRMYEQLGRYSDAIAAFKAIAAEERYYALIRAYAVQELGAMYHLYYADLATITAETFKDEPYASFKKNADYDTAYRKLFEYATSIYPLAYSESFVAYGYTKALVSIKGATTTSQGQQYVASIATALQRADADFPRLAKNHDEQLYAPSVLSREAIVTGYLVRVGVPGYTNGAAESLYNRALQYSATIGLKPGNFVVYHYALLLARAYGKERATDLHTLLAVFSEKNGEKIAPEVPVFFKAVLTDPSQVSEKANVKLLGKLDPDFKAYLLSLGWHASDFSGT